MNIREQMLCDAQDAREDAEIKKKFVFYKAYKKIKEVSEIVEVYMQTPPKPRMINVKLQFKGKEIGCLN